MITLNANRIRELARWVRSTGYQIESRYQKRTKPSQSELTEAAGVFIRAGIELAGGINSEQPTPEQVRALRLKLDLTQASAAAIALVSTRAWIKYESGENQIPAPVWALFLLRTR